MSRFVWWVLSLVTFCGGGIAAIAWYADNTPVLVTILGVCWGALSALVLTGLCWPELIDRRNSDGCPPGL